MGQTTFSGPVASQGGFLDSSFTTAERDAIVNPETGLLIYNTTVNQYQVYNGSAWIEAFAAAPSYPVFAYNRNATASDLLFTVNAAGTVVYTIQGGGGTFTITPYTLGSAWNVTSVTAGTPYTQGFSVYNSYTPTLAFNGDGTKIFTLIDDAGTYANSMDLGTAYDISTLSGTFTKNGSTVTGFGSISNIKSLTYADSGTKAFVLDTASGNATVRQWNLASAYDLTSFSGAADATLAIQTLLGSSNSFKSFTFSADGLYAYVMTQSLSNEAILYELSVGTAFDLSTISGTPLQTYNMVTLGAFDAGGVSGGGVALDATGLKMLATGPSSKIAQLTAP